VKNGICQEVNTVFLLTIGRLIRLVGKGCGERNKDTRCCNGRHIVTDSYEWGKIAFGDGTVPLRFIDLQERSEETIVRINVGNPGAKEILALRVDPQQ
jgi:hypothetical protein